MLLNFKLSRIWCFYLYFLLDYRPVYWTYTMKNYTTINLISHLIQIAKGTLLDCPSVCWYQGWLWMAKLTNKCDAWRFISRMSKVWNQTYKRWPCSITNWIYGHKYLEHKIQKYWNMLPHWYPLVHQNISRSSYQLIWKCCVNRQLWKFGIVKIIVAYIYI